MTTARHMRLGAALVAGLAFVLTSGAIAKEPVRVKPVDFDLPLGVAEMLPAGVPTSQVFMTEDFCFYYRQDGRYHFLTCVG